MAENGFFSEEFIQSIVRAGAQARIETLQAGVPVFYWDYDRKLDIMELPNGRKYEIRFIPGAPRESNYEIIREIEETAA